MSKIVEGVFTSERIREVIELLQQDKYVTMDSNTALEAIKTILTAEQLSVFIDNALEALENTTFSPLNFEQIREYIEREFQMLQERNDQNFDINSMRQLFDNCEIYAQRYDIDVINPKSKVFIWWTPTQQDFNVAKNKISELLNSFQEGANGNNLKDVKIMIRGKEKFVDIKIENINDKAWVGFDFR
jgi:hypothetical protein